MSGLYLTLFGSKASDFQVGTCAATHALCSFSCILVRMCLVEIALAATVLPAMMRLEPRTHDPNASKTLFSLGGFVFFVTDYMISIHKGVHTKSNKTYKGSSEILGRNINKYAHFIQTQQLA